MSYCCYDKFGKGEIMKKTPDYGHPTDSFVAKFVDENNMPIKDYFKKPLFSAGQTMSRHFFEKVIRKSFVLNEDNKSFSFDEDQYYKNAVEFWEQVFVKVTIDTEIDKCLTCTVKYANLEASTKTAVNDESDDVMNEIFDTKKVSSLMTKINAQYPEKKIDIGRLHKCGEIHVPKDRAVSAV